MIELRINGTALELPAGLQLTREIETTIFNRELTVTDFTYPADLPLTDEVVKALGYPNSIANPNLKQDYYADFIVNGIYVDYCILRVLKVNLQTKAASVSIIGKYGSFAKMLGGKKLNELNLGGLRTIGSLNSAYEQLPSYFYPSSLDTIYIWYKGCDNVKTHINDVNSGAVVTDYVFGQHIEELSNLAMQNNCVNVVNGHNYWNAGQVGIIDPVRFYLKMVPGFMAQQSNELPRLYWWSPQFRFAYLIRQCFEEFGFVVNAPILANASIQQFVMPNSYAINRCNITKAFANSNQSLVLHVDHDATQIDPRNHVAAMTVVEFLQEAGKLLNLHYDIDLRDMTVEIRQIQLPDSYGDAVDLTAVAAPDPIMNYEQQDYSRGYKFSFADTGTAEVRDDVNKYQFLGAIETRLYLPTSFGSAVEKDVVMVLDENAFYQFDGVDWVFYSDNLGPYSTSQEENLQEITSKCIPLKMRRDNVPLVQYAGSPTGTVTYYDTGDAQVNAYSNYGISGRGLLAFDYDKLGKTGTNPQKAASCFFTVNAKQDEHNPGIANWLGMQRVIGWAAGVTYPQLGCQPASNYYGSALSGYALCWQIASLSGTYFGLADVFWRKFVDALKACVEAEYEVLLDPQTYNNLDWNGNLFRIAGLWYLCKKATVQLPLPGVATLTLVRV